MTDGGDVHVYEVVDVKLRTQSAPTFEAVTPVVELTVVAHEPVPIVTGGAGAAKEVCGGMTLSAEKMTTTSESDRMT